MGTETILCECGIYVCGKSPQNARGNMKQHIKTEKHRNQLARKKVSELPILHGRTIINKDGDYEYHSQGYSWDGVKEISKQISIINFEKNDGFSDQVLAIAELNKINKKKEKEVKE